jgi:integrase/recombinase XerD
VKQPVTISENPFSSALGEPLYRFLKIKRTAGYKYREEERSLFALDNFLKSVLTEGPPVISYEIAKQYLTRWGRENDTTRSHRLGLLRQFCRFLVLEEPRTFVPPKRFMGIKRCSFTPRILTRDEGQRFILACLTFPPAHCSPLRGAVLGTALLVLFFTGLRVGEVLRLTVQDVDLDGGLLRIRESKFGKSRYVPLAADLVEHLRLYCRKVAGRLGQRDPRDPFLCTSQGKPYSMSAVQAAFRQTLARAGIAWMGKGKGPRLHDLRHNAAVLRMLLWYEQGVDLEAKLPLLATYLGHKDLLGTQKYLHLTEELLTNITSRYQARFGHLISG